MLTSAVAVLFRVSEYFSCVVYFLCQMGRVFPYGFPRIHIRFSFSILIGEKSKVCNTYDARVHSVDTFQTPLLDLGGDAVAKTEAGHAVTELSVGLRHLGPRLPLCHLLLPTGREGGVSAACTL